MSILEGEDLIGGFIDLAYQTAGGNLVIVDYKTNKSKNPASLGGTYQMQMGVYAKSLERATGLPVESCVLLVLTRQGEHKGATEVKIEGAELEAAKQMVGEVLSEATQKRSAFSIAR